MILLRSLWGISPFRHSALKLRPMSWLQSASVAYLVLQNTMALVYPCLTMISVMSASLLRPVVSRLYWSMRGALSSTGSTVISSGFF